LLGDFEIAENFGAASDDQRRQNKTEIRPRGAQRRQWPKEPLTSVLANP
jgi:hypothetical protein